MAKKFFKYSFNILTVIAIFGIMCFLISCSGFNGYEGDSPALFSVAINSIPNTNGYIAHEVTEQPVLQVLDSDDYGRILFCYTEEKGYYNSDENRQQLPYGGVNLIICQSYDEQYAYYYRNCNYISAPLCEGNEIWLYGSRRQAEIKDPYNGFKESDIEELKQKNDWNLEIDIAKCNEVRIVRRIML